ncbi:MAG TPA: general secretion pathway protein GspB [Chiayiivirga sp.]|nr:general secretion pathway protein GspB [Chiayiivirga sp.]
MSLILEALKKSEAERRLGQAPDLLSPTPMRVPSESHSRGLGRALWIGLVVVAAGAGYWFAHDRAGPAPSTPETAAPVTTPAPPSPAAVPASPTPSPRPRLVSYDANVIAEASLPRDDEFAGNERESQPVHPETIALPAPAEAAALDDAPEPVRAPRVETATPARATIPTRTAASPSVEHAAAPAPAPTPPAAPEPVLESLPRLGHLLPSEREGLPPLRLSMHVYDPVPAARFVLIDGKRYREGNTIADGLTVEAIRPDGAALSYHGRRFLLARP